MRNGFRFVCKNSVVLLLALFPFLQLGAQSQEFSVGAGDTIVLGKPTSPEVYAYIDIFRKTRWDPKPLPNDEFTQKFGTYDSSTGNGFFRWVNNMGLVVRISMVPEKPLPTRRHSL